MALRIRSDEADRLVRLPAAETGESLTQAIIVSLRERLERERARRGTDLGARVGALQAEVVAPPVLDDRSPDEVLGYDDAGLPA